MWHFEKRFIPDVDISSGPFRNQPMWRIWLASSLALLFVTFIVYFTGQLEHKPLAFYLFISIILPLLSRLISLDLKYLILPNIYILPLCFLGFLYSFFSGHIIFKDAFFGFIVGGFGLLFLDFLMEKVTNKNNIGGGDIKLTFAVGAFIGLSYLHYFFWLSFLFSLVFYPILKAQNRYISFGPALILSLWIMIIWPTIIEDFIFLLIL